MASPTLRHYISTDCEQTNPPYCISLSFTKYVLSSVMAVNLLSNSVAAHLLPICEYPHFSFTQSSQTRKNYFDIKTANASATRRFQSPKWWRRNKLKNQDAFFLQLVCHHRLNVMCIYVKESKPNLIVLLYRIKYVDNKHISRGLDIWFEKGEKCVLFNNLIGSFCIKHKVPAVPSQSQQSLRHCPITPTPLTSFELLSCRPRPSEESWSRATSIHKDGSRPTRSRQLS